MNTSKTVEYVEFGIFCGRVGIGVGAAERLMKAARAMYRANELECSCPDVDVVDRAEKRAANALKRARAALPVGKYGLRQEHDPRGPALWIVYGEREYPVPDR